MPGEKELNINLFERLDLLDRLERAAKKGKLRTRFTRDCI